MDQSITELILTPLSQEIYESLKEYLSNEAMNYVEQSLETDVAIAEQDPDKVTFQIVVYFDDETAAKLWMHKFYRKFNQTSVRATFNVLINAIWQDAWDEQLTDVISERFWIHQKGLSIASSPSHDLEKVIIDAKNAFGTGQHATTLASLRLIEKLPVSTSFLDVGTGTGILAIVAQKMGYKRIVATDIDIDAIESACINFGLNNCDIELLNSSFPEKNEAFDVVVSNILVPEVIRLIPELVGYVSKDRNARLVLSGFHEANENMVINEIAKYGLLLCDRSTERSWQALCFQWSN